MSLREWLIAIGTLVILGIVIDGLRRMRRARKESMAISSGMGANELEESPLDEEFNPELPNGGARTISRDTLEERGYVKKSTKSRFGKPTPKPTRPVYTAESDSQAPPASEPEQEQEIPQEPWPREEEHEALESGWSALDDESTAEPQPESEPEPMQTDDVQPEPQTAPAAGELSDVEEDTARRPAADPDQPPAGANRPEAQEVIVINVLAKADSDFQGGALRKLFDACGLLHGDMGIYHRHESSDTRSPVQFSVANAVEPGTFSPADMAQQSTPGISFFMSLPGPSNALQAFDFMLETAQCVVHNLGGELKDERRSVMTGQTIEHCRQRIREYERKRRSRPH
ncbi:cell division protein ZipA [Marinobacter xestospongiae]|uniref:cell division protein ZipA n=1 Tax=Marinobacter xestospongiae TaxID=994319 RepID=UPI002005250F|nr:cell division protein ZipA [Marinobacter xestospongiae]MCK7565729.1 cell division protein ZipA [Marinobacter xestospongiae]